MKELIRVEPLPEAAGADPAAVAGSLRDLPGLALLESTRQGRRGRWSYLTADPVVDVEIPAEADRLAMLPVDPFAEARATLGRSAPGLPPRAGAGLASSTRLPPFLGGLVGYLAYDLGRLLVRLPSIAPDDQGLPLLRLGLHDWVVAWDRRDGAAWLAGRAVDGDAEALDRRLQEVRRRILAHVRERSIAGAPGRHRSAMAFTSNLDQQDYTARVEAIRSAIAAGEIYQANFARRLEVPWSHDPWPLYLRLRAGDAATHGAYLDLGRGRALLSASPEPFLQITPDGAVTTDPIKGTRPRGRDRAQDRDIAHELLASAKDRAENVMIVDVLRNDLGRVCRPGSVGVPRLCRLERSAAVQHLVSTVAGRLREGADPFDLLTATFPGGSISGAPKLRAMEIIEGLEPVRRGPYSGAIGWIGPDGAMATSIAIRTFVGDGRRLTLHVGGAITWRSDPAAEWDETVAKARGPISAIGATAT